MSARGHECWDPCDHLACHSATRRALNTRNQKVREGCTLEQAATSLIRKHMNRLTDSDAKVMHVDQCIVHTFRSQKQPITHQERYQSPDIVCKPINKKHEGFRMVGHSFL